MEASYAQSQKTAVAGSQGFGPYRLNVTALLRIPRCNQGEQSEQAQEGSFSPWMYVLCRRADFGAWQCPQGGLEADDASLQAGVLRELQEELGLPPHRVRIIYESRYWRRYDFAMQKASSERASSYRGQQQKWFLAQIEKLSDCDLESALGEFSEVALVDEVTLYERYAAWKAGVFVDFLRELGLAGTEPLVGHPEATS